VKLCGATLGRTGSPTRFGRPISRGSDSCTTSAVPARSRAELETTLGSRRTSRHTTACGKVPEAYGYAQGPKIGSDAGFSFYQALRNFFVSTARGHSTAHHRRRPLGTLQFQRLSGGQIGFDLRRRMGARRPLKCPKQPLCHCLRRAISRLVGDANRC
jgi:hypothetical protein